MQLELKIGYLKMEVIKHHLDLLLSFHFLILWELLIHYIFNFLIVNGIQLDLDVVTQNIINVDRPCESIQHSNTVVT